jgi:hypothetical protein
MHANKMGMTIGGTNQAAMAATPARFLGSSYSGGCTPANNKTNTTVAAAKRKRFVRN